MAKLVVSSADYSFNAAAKTVTFGAALTGLELQDIALITNLVDGLIIFQFNKPGYGGTLAGLVLTLDYDTTSMSNTDTLRIDVSADFIADKVEVVSGGGGTEYVEDDAVPANPSGLAPVAERDDALAALTPVDGDWTHLRTNDRGALWVSIADGTGGQITSFGAGTEYTEGTTDATITGVAILMEGAGDTLLPVPGSTAGGILVNLGTNNDVSISNTVTVSDGGGSVTIDGTVAATQSGTWNINNISGTVSLPTGAATAANQATQTTALQLLDNVVAVDGAAAVTSLYQVGGTDGVNAQILSTTSSGHLNVSDGGNSLTVDGSVAATQSGAWSVGLDAGTNNIGDVDVLTVPAPLNVVGGGTEATALRVTIANNSTGVISVDDNGSSLTIDGTVAVSSVAAGTNYIGKLRLTDGTTDAEVVPLAGYNAQAVAIVDASGAQITDFTGTTNVEYTGGDVIPGQPTGIMPAWWDDGGGLAKITSTSDPLPVAVSNTAYAFLTAGTNYAGKFRLTDGTTDAEVVPLAGYSAQAVAIVDGSGAQITSFGGGTQYTEGDTDATITGTAVLWEDAGDTLVVPSASKPLPVNIISGASSGTEYTEGDTDASITGQAMLMEGAADTLVPLQGTVADGLLVNLGANNDVTVTGAVTVADGGGSITVDGTVAATQSGSWNVGLNAGTNNIGDVDVLTVPAPLNVVGGGTEAAALRVTIANNSTGVLSVDDNGSSLTVDGTVAATQSGTWNITNVSGTVSLPTGAATAANQATAITALQLLDNVVATDGSAALTSLYQVGGTDGVNAQILSTNSSGHLNIADGGNSITVDGTVAVSGTVPVTDNGGSLTVDGTVAATQSGAWSVGINAGTNNIGDVDVLTVPAPLSTTGGGTEATALRVTIANDSTGVVSIDDNGGSITVDGTVTVTDGGGALTVDGDVSINSISAGTNYIGKVRLTDGTTDGEIVPLAGYNAQAVAIVDAAGAQITSFGGGIQYTEGDTDATITGTAMLWEDAADTLRTVSAANPLPVSMASTGTTWAVVEAVTSTAYALGSAAYSDSSSIADDYVLDHIQFNFSTTQSRDITVTLANGTVLYDVTGDTSLNLVLNNIDLAQDGGDNFTIDITQTGGACALDVSAVIRQGDTPIASGSTVKLQDGTGNAISSHSAGGSRGIDVSIIDGSGNQITSFGGGTQYAEGDVAATITGTAMLFETNTGTNTLGVVSSSNPLPISDNGSTVSIDDGGGTITVDGTVSAAQSGSWGVDLNAGTNNIGDVDVLTVPAPLSTSGGGTEATALRVTIANDSTGVLSIDDNGSSLTVDGTVAATQSGTWNITNISGTVSLPTGASTAANQSTMITALQTIDNSIGTEGAAKPGGVTFIAGSDGTNARAISTNTSGHVNIADGGNSITVDGTVVSRIADASSNVYDSTTGGALGGTERALLVRPVYEATRDVGGNVAHDGVDSGNPVKLGAKAIAHGSNPTAVAAGDRTDLYANRHGIPFTIGGHPNIITRTAYIADADGAQTNATLVGTIAAGTKVVVTAVAVTVDSAVTATGGVSVKLGFGAASIPADAAGGANGILLDHKGIAAGSGIVMGSGAGILGIGGDGEELRLTCEDPVGGGLSVTFSYYTIES